MSRPVGRDVGNPWWVWMLIGATLPVLAAWSFSVAPDSDGPAALASTSPGRTDVSWVRLDNGTWTVLGWDPCRPVSVRWNPGQLGPNDRAAFREDLRAALALTGAASGVNFVLGGTTLEIPQQSLSGDAGDIVIAVAEPGETDLPIGAAGIGYTQTRAWVWPTTAEARPGARLGRAGIVLDRTALVSLPPGVRPGQSRGNVILHELGHAVGLRHSTRGEALMAPELRTDAAAGWSVDDLDALRAVGSTTCRSSPAEVREDP